MALCQRDSWRPRAGYLSARRRRPRASNPAGLTATAPMGEQDKERRRACQPPGQHLWFRDYFEMQYKAGRCVIPGSSSVRGTRSCPCGYLKAAGLLVVKGAESINTSIHPYTKATIHPSMRPHSHPSHYTSTHPYIHSHIHIAI